MWGFELIRFGRRFTFSGIPNCCFTIHAALRRAWWRAKWLADGTLYDHYRRETPICIGDTIRKAVTLGTDFHGHWADYAVVLQGQVPMLSYRCSEKGKKLPDGYIGCWLTELYDTKLSLFACDPSTLKPKDLAIVVVEGMQWPVRLASEDDD